MLFGLPSIALIGGHYLSEIFAGSASFFAFILLILSVLVNLISPIWTSRINSFIASLVLVCIVTIAIIGLGIVVPEGTMKLPPNPPTISLSEFGFGFMMVFFAFTGWEVAANLSDDFHNPKRDFPRAMAFSFIIAVVLYLALALIASSIELGDRAETPFSLFFEIHFGVQP